MEVFYDLRIYTLPKTPIFTFASSQTVKMKFLLVSCLAAFSAISLVYAAEGDVCNRDNPCEVGCCSVPLPPPRPDGMGGMDERPPGPPGGMEGMMDQRPPGPPPGMEGEMGNWPPGPPRGMGGMMGHHKGGHKGGHRHLHPKNGTCSLGNEGSPCMFCPPEPPTPRPTTVSPSTDGSTTDSSSTVSFMQGPKGWRPPHRPGGRPGPHHLRPTCAEGLMCSMESKTCVNMPSTTVSTQGTTLAA